MIQSKELNRRPLVLVVEDQEINRDLLGMILEDDYDVIYAENGEEGLEAIRANRNNLSIILLDLMMPVMDGFQVLDALAKDPELKSIPVIVLTAEKDAELKALQMGAVDFITKPLTYYTFQLRFQRAVDRARQRVDDEILLTLRDGVVKVSVRQIYYVEVQNRMLIYHTMNGDYTMRGTMKSVEEQLAKYHFVKCNHWYIVNLSHVERISKDTVTVAGTELEISRRSRTSFLNALTDFMGGAR